MPEVDLDGVESGVDRQSCRGGVCRDHLIDVLGAGVFGEAHPDRVEEPHRCQRPGLIGCGIRHRTGMADLGADCRALGVNGLGQAA